MSGCGSYAGPPQPISGSCSFAATLNPRGASSFRVGWLRSWSGCPTLPVVHGQCSSTPLWPVYLFQTCFSILNAHHYTTTLYSIAYSNILTDSPIQQSRYRSDLALGGLGLWTWAVGHHVHDFCVWTFAPLSPRPEEWSGHTGLFQHAHWEQLAAGAGALL